MAFRCIDSCIVAFVYIPEGTTEQQKFPDEEQLLTLFVAQLMTNFENTAAIRSSPDTDQSA